MIEKNQINEFFESDKNKITAIESKNHNSLVFAYIGDAVFSLFIRNYFAVNSNYKAGVLNTLSNKVVRASSQAVMYDYLKDVYNEDELRVGNSARNVKTNNVAKNSSLIEYKKATAFEAVLGYLYMTNNNERLMFLLQKSIEYANNEILNKK